MFRGVFLLLHYVCHSRGFIATSLYTRTFGLFYRVTACQIMHPKKLNTRLRAWSLHAFDDLVSHYWFFSGQLHFISSEPIQVGLVSSDQTILLKTSTVQLAYFLLGLFTEILTSLMHLWVLLLLDGSAPAFLNTLQRAFRDNC